MTTAMRARIAAPRISRRMAATHDGAPSRDSRYDAMLAVLMNFRVVVRTMRSHYRRVERACGVSGAYVWALAQIADTRGLKVTEVAQQLAIHQSTASNMLDKLERAGLVERVRSHQDRRVVCVQATARGRRVIARAPAPVRGALQQALMDMPLVRLDALRDELGELLRRMNAGMRGAEETTLADTLAPDEASRRPRGARTRQRR